MRLTGMKRFLNLWVLMLLFLCGGAYLVAVHVLSLIEAMRFPLARTCASARLVYQREGREGLSSMTRSFELATGIHPFLLDSTGRDLATGENRYGLLSHAESASSLPFPPRQALLVERTGGYACVMAGFDSLGGEQGPHAPRPSLLGAPFVWFLPFLAAFCCTVALYVNMRARRIGTAIADFGSGQRGIRMETEARDPFGHLSRAFNRMAERVDSLMESDRRLRRDLPHELRSPLTRLTLWARLARFGTPGALDRIEQELARLKDLVNQLLDVAHAEADPASLSVETVDLCSLLAEIADRCEIEAAERGCEIALNIAHGCTVQGDLELLRRAIENVLRNAIRHSPAGAPIELSVDCGDTHAVISVRDRGPGVPSAELEAIFRPFYRIQDDQNRNTGGVGLGLAIAERVATLHRGSVRAENVTPGLRVGIHLPRNRIGQA